MFDDRCTIASGENVFVGQGLQRRPQREVASRIAGKSRIRKPRGSFCLRRDDGSVTGDLASRAEADVMRRDFDGGVMFDDINAIFRQRRASEPLCPRWMAGQNTGSGILGCR